MKILQTLAFKRKYKKLHTPQQQIVKDAIAKILEQLDIGVMKKGDLSGVRIYKFKANNQEILLAYSVLDTQELILLALGSHENFYRDLSKHLLNRV